MLGRVVGLIVAVGPVGEDDVEATCVVSSQGPHPLENFKHLAILFSVQEKGKTYNATPMEMK